MNLTKQGHACVVLDKGSGRLVVDPGSFTTNAAELLENADTVLVTHEHFDHFDEQTIAAALRARPELKAYGPAAVVGRWLPDLGAQVTAVTAGDRFAAAGFEVTAVGGVHAAIHHDIPQVVNVGFLVDDSVYHPGDSYYVPPGRVATLLLPTSGPWTKLGEAVDFVRSVRPEQVVQIHETLLSEAGQQATARFINAGGLTEVSLTILPVGETISA